MVSLRSWLIFAYKCFCAACQSISMLSDTPWIFGDQVGCFVETGICHSPPVPVCGGGPASCWTHVGARCSRWSAIPSVSGVTTTRTVIGPTLSLLGLTGSPARDDMTTSSGPVTTTLESCKLALRFNSDYYLVLDTWNWNVEDCGFDSLLTHCLRHIIL